jgi:hypothetical protein
MPYEIINTLRARSVIRITGNTATRINLSQLSTNTTTETVSAASITYVNTSTDGKWSIYRGNDATGVLVLEYFGENDLPLTQHDLSIANSSTSNIYVTNSGTGGTLILQVSKSASYNPVLTGI